MGGDGWLRRWLCARRRRRRRAAKLVLWGEEARAVEPGRTAGEVIAEHAGAGGGGCQVVCVCRADGFRLGRPTPVLAVEDRLEAGRTYLVIPVDRLPQGRGAVVTAASLAALAYDKGRGGGPPLAGGERSPFEYVKNGDGRTVIRVTQEFIVKTVSGRQPPPRGAGALCSTPELRKHYEQLVGAARGRPWSPRLETISERRKGTTMVEALSPRRLSPARLTTRA